MKNLGINGFGRIGRTAFRVWWDFYKDKTNLCMVNTSGSMELKDWAHLLKYDSNYGVWDQEIRVEQVKKVKELTDHDCVLGYLFLGDYKVTVTAQRDPAKLPWGVFGIDTVIESTGVFTTKEKASLHMQGGAKNVVISAPAKGDGVHTGVLGVNEVTGEVISNASCTTNCVAPVTQVIHDEFIIEKAMMTTVHAYTDDQNLHDNSHRDMRRARSAAKNIVPTTTGAAIAVTEVIPELAGKFDGISMRVPVAVGSISDMVFIVKNKTTVEEVNAALVKASKLPRFQGILAVTEEALVSQDIVGRRESSIVDLNMTQVIDGDMVKVVSWYDNEFGYCNRLIEQAIGS